MAVDYPDPLEIPVNGINLVPDGGAEASGEEIQDEVVLPFSEYVPSSTVTFELTETNLALNPSCETDTRGWYSNQTSRYPVSRSTTAPISGTASAMTTRTEDSLDSVAASVYLTGTLDGNFTPVTADQVITLAVDVRAELAGRDFIVTPLWRTASGYVAATSVRVADVPAGEVMRLVVTEVIPATTISVALAVNVEGPDVVVDEKVWFDNFVIKIGSTDSAYFDGDTPDTATDTYNWVGTSNASASQRYQPVAPPTPPADLVVTRTPDTVHNGSASFRIDKTGPVDRTFRIGVQVDLDGLEVDLLCVIDYWIFLPPGSGANATTGALGLQPMPEVLDMTLSGPEDLDDFDERGLSITMRSDPPLTENSWLHQQVTFYPTRSNHMFRLVITYNDVYVAPQSFYLDDIVVVQDESFGRYLPPPPPVVVMPTAPPVVIKAPVPVVFCGTDPRSKVTPIMLVSGTNLFSDIRAYWYIEGYHPDGSPRKVYPPETIEQFNAEYTSYDDIVSGYTQVMGVTRTDGHNSITKVPIQYVFPVPINEGQFAIMDIDAPLDTWVKYVVTIRQSGYPTKPDTTWTTQECRVDINDFAPAYTGCSPALLSDPLVVSSAQWFGLTGIDPLSWNGRRELLEVISRSYPISQSDLRLMPRTNIRGITMDLTERQKMLDILMTGRILRLRIPDDQYPESNWYISVGQVTENRIFSDHRRPERRWELEVAVVEKPIGTVNNWDYTRNYTMMRDKESDGVTNLNPKHYDKIRQEYADYLNVLYGKTYTSLNANLPTGLVYGDGRFPTREAVQTSINWFPEAPVP